MKIAIAEFESESVRRLRHVKGMALALVALLLALVCISALVRLEAAGFGCADWPACYGRMLSGSPNLHAGVARILHRLAASTALLLAFATAWHCLQPRPLQPVARRATILVLLMLFLAFIGIWSSDPRRVLVSFINIIGGLALVSLSGHLAMAGAPVREMPSRLFKPGMAALTATLLLGALIGARHGAISCTTLPDCNGIWWPTAAIWPALNPFPAITAPLAPGDGGGVALNLLHRYAALVTLLLLGGAAHRALGVPELRRAGMVLLVLLASVVLLGGLMVASGFKLWLGVGHSVAAAALLASAATLRR